MVEYKSRVERKEAEKLARQASKQAPVFPEKNNKIDGGVDSSASFVESEAVVVSLPDSAASAGDKMVQGAFWMTFGSIFSRLLGALYIIPWNAMMGASKNIGNALFAVGYGPYQIFLSIGIAGFPSAMSKQIAQYNAKGQYQAGEKLFKKSMLFMLVTGVVSSILMFVFAPLIASNSPGASTADNMLVIRALAPALLIVPIMSLVRGYFQGYQDMVPSAITQVVEQVVRVAYILLATFLVMRVFHGSVATAVAHSTFAAFVGAAASSLMLVWYYRKHMQVYRPLLDSSREEVQIQTSDALKEMVRESIPFIIVGSGIAFGKMIDQFTFKQIMTTVTEYDNVQIGELYGLFSFNADKLIMIIISLAVGLSATSIPLLVENYTKKNYAELGSQIKKIFDLFAFVMFPSALGMMVVARPIYHLFYGLSEYTPEGIKLLGIASVMSIILGGFTISASILQSFGKHFEAILYLVIGLILKMALQYQMLNLFETAGALYATSIGFLVTTLLSLRKIYQLVPFDLKASGKTIGTIGLIAGWMAGIAKITLLFFGIFLSPERKLGALLLVLLAAAAGGFVFLYLSLKTRIADEVLGGKVGAMRGKLKIK